MNWVYRLGCGLAVVLAPAALWGQGSAPIPPMLSDGTVQSQPGPAAGFSGQYQIDRNRASNIYDIYGHYEGGFPTTDVRIAVDADARAAFARMQLQRAQNDLTNALRMTQAQFERSKEMADALAEETQAYEDYLVARQAALAPVQSNLNYQANAGIKQDLAKEINDKRDAKHPDNHQIVALSRTKLDYAQVISDMESKALKDNAGVLAARKKLMAAGQKVAALRDNFDMAIRTNPDLIALRRQVEDAQIARVVAATYRRDTIDAANCALDYAYYRDRFNYYNCYPYNNTPLYQSPYGTNYGYPFGAH